MEIHSSHQETRVLALMMQSQGQVIGYIDYLNSISQEKDEQIKNLHEKSEVQEQKIKKLEDDLLARQSLIRENNAKISRLQQEIDSRK